MFLDMTEKGYEFSRCRSFSIGVMGRGIASRTFKLSEFKEEWAHGYVKLEKLDDELFVRVIDTYNQESLEEELNYLEQGYVKMGYPSKQVDNV